MQASLTTEEKARFGTLMRFRAPDQMAHALKRAAKSELTTESEYLRRAAIRALRDGGFLPNEAA
jgi:hypothetical protein